METIYLVSWCIHNKSTKEWAGTIVDKFTDLSAAKKEYHSQLSMYINDDNFDSVAVMLTDSYGNMVMSEYWTNYVEPNVEE